MKTNLIIATYCIFLLGHLVPNMTIHSFKYHEVDLWTYSLPLMIIGSITGIIVSFKISRLYQLPFYIVIAISGIISGYVIELLAKPFYSDWWLGVRWHLYFFRDTFWRQLLPFSGILLFAYIIFKFKKKSDQTNHLDSVPPPEI